MVPQIWSVTDRIFCHFELLSALWPKKSKLKKKWKKHMEISSFYTREPKTTIICYTVPKTWCMTDCYFSFWATFCPFTPLTPKKKTPGDIIILHKCTKYHDHMLYCSWDMAHDRCNCYVSFWAIFCPFTTNSPHKKWKFEKNEKSSWRYHHFTQVHQKSWSYAVLFLRYGMWEV